MFYIMLGFFIITFKPGSQTVNFLSESGGPSVYLQQEEQAKNNKHCSLLLICKWYFDVNSLLMKQDLGAGRERSVLLEWEQSLRVWESGFSAREALMHHLPLTKK